MVTNAQQLDAIIEVGFLEATTTGIQVKYRWLQDYLLGAAPLVSGPGKYVIGLTGNIAVGKSTVLNLLESLGAQIIDADRLVHQLREPGAAGFQPVVDLLGPDVLDDNGRINPAELGRRAFTDEQVLRQLERIFHPLVRAEVDQQIAHSPKRVVVIEAIKLLEGQLKARVQAVWVVHASRQTQIERLIQSRNLSEQEAVRRVEAQNPQEEKLAQADVIIENDGEIAHTQRQVLRAWLDVLDSMAQTGTLDGSLIVQLLSYCEDAAAFALPTTRFTAYLRRVAERTGLSRAGAAALLTAE